MSNKLFEPLKIGSLALKNRITMAPMTRNRATSSNVPTDIMAEYYGLRADAGLIITEGTSPSPNGTGYPRIPGIYTDEQIAGWKKVTDAVHNKGGRIFLQLMHNGRIGHSSNLPEGAEVVAPSAIAAAGQVYSDTAGMVDHPVPRAMTTEEVKSTIGEYVIAAKNAIDAGFDGVEFHGANGYLIEQFINPRVNQRTDEYGGDIESRSRFLLEIVTKAITAIGKDKIGVRFSPYGVFNDMPVYDEIDETYQYLAGKLSDLGILYVHLTDHSAMGAPPVPQRVKDIIRHSFKNTLILCGGFDQHVAEKALENGDADLIAFARPFIANPNLVEDFRTGAELSQPDFEKLYTPGPEGYLDFQTV